MMALTPHSPMNFSTSALKLEEYSLTCIPNLEHALLVILALNLPLFDLGPEVDCFLKFIVFDEMHESDLLKQVLLRVGLLEIGADAV